MKSILKQTNSTKILFSIPLFLIFSVCTISCNSTYSECTFINEKINLHSEYYVTILNVDDYDNIFVFKNKNDYEKSELIGTSTHFVGMKILIQHQNVSFPKENHKFDKNDFKLKDHTGVQIENINLFSKKNGFALSTKTFSTKQPIIDYSWYEKSVESGEEYEFTLYYEFPKSYSVYDTIMVLEVDFFVGAHNNRTGSDIVLAYREEQ